MFEEIGYISHRFYDSYYHHYGYKYSKWVKTYDENGVEIGGREDRIFIYENGTFDVYDNAGIEVLEPIRKKLEELKGE